MCGGLPSKKKREEEKISQICPSTDPRAYMCKIALKRRRYLRRRARSARRPCTRGHCAAACASFGVARRVACTDRLHIVSKRTLGDSEERRDVKKKHKRHFGHFPRKSAKVRQRQWSRTGVVIDCVHRLDIRPASPGEPNGRHALARPAFVSGIASLRPRRCDACTRIIKAGPARAF